MEKHYRIVYQLANLLDNQFNFLGIRFGLSGIIGFVPGLGDVIDAALSLYIIWISLHLKVPASAISKMVWNVIVNFAIALIPVVGDATYILRRVNIKNLKIIEQYIPKKVIEAQIV